MPSSTIVLTILLLVKLGTARDDTCIGSGVSITECCNSGPCTSADGSCYCDYSCHDFNDCCSDINETACARKARTCVASGYPAGEGCCDPNAEEDEFCASKDGSCHCDALCHNFNDCCEDIGELGCSAPGGNTCAGNGYDIGCCDIATSTCRSSDGTCYCDVSCHENFDCCSDIDDIGCLSNTCQGSGYPTGSICCELNEEEDEFCLSDDGSCRCDYGCSENDDCCLGFIGSECPSPFALGGCLALGLPVGQCCDTSGNCLAESGCWCDQTCFNYGDCCDDIDELGCSSP